MKKIRPSESIRRAYQRLSAAFGENDAQITLPQTAILRTLLESGPLKQRQIVEASGMDRSTLSFMLKKLGSSGLIVAVRFEGDARASMVSITPAGRKALQKSEWALERAEAAVMDLIPPPDRPAFLRALRAVAVAP